MIVLPPQAFELATGDYLFEPHSGEDYSRDEGIPRILSSCTLCFLINRLCYVLVVFFKCVGRSIWC